jgi:hypothetical protein
MCPVPLLVVLLRTVSLRCVTRASVTHTLSLAFLGAVVVQRSCDVQAGCPLRGAEQRLAHDTFVRVLLVVDNTTTPVSYEVYINGVLSVCYVRCHIDLSLSSRVLCTGKLFIDNASKLTNVQVEWVRSRSMSHDSDA